MCSTKKGIFIIMFAVCNLIAHAQEGKISFKHLSLKEGLSQSPIFSIMEDKTGFIWIGSRSGLTRYDGYEFKVYPNDEFNKSISQRDINAIEEDADGNLWLATSGGLYMFVRNTERFVKVKVNDVKFTSSLYPAGNNKLWITTDMGVKLLDCKTQQITDFISHRQSGMFVHTICKDNKGGLWLSSVNGLSYYRVADGKQLPVSQSLINKLNKTVKRIFSIRADTNGDLWIGTENAGLFWYKKETDECINFTHQNGNESTILSDFVKDVFINSANEIWVGTRSGLSIFNKTTGQFTNYEHHNDIRGSLSHNTIWKIMKDAVGSIWIATYAGGLNVYNPIYTNFSTIGERIGNNWGLNQPVVNAILEDGDEAIWAGTDGGGLNYINFKKGISRYYSVQDFAKQKKSNSIKGIARDDKGNIWVATLDGLAKFNQVLGKTEFVSLKPNGSETIFRANGLLCTQQGIWVAGDTEGLIYRKFDGSLKYFVNTPGKNSISSNHVNCMIEGADKQGLWIGTRDGLCYLDYATEKITTYPLQKDYRSNIIISIYRDNLQQLWLGTQLGLYLFNEKQKTNTAITTANGLADNTIQAISQDFNGNLWVSTSNGLSKIKFKSKNVTLTKGNYEVTNYTANDGLNSNLWMQNTVARNKLGCIFFGGVNGINYFHPDEIKNNQNLPKVLITRFMIKNEDVPIGKKQSPLAQPIEQTKSITLKYNQNSFSFQFAALDFINPKKNSYAYKMEGLSYNQEWNFSGNQRIAYYTGLEPGTYTFKVKAANNDGLWNNVPHSIKVTILPPFWATWWAYVFYWLAALTLFYYIIRFFRRQAKLERDLYYEHLQYERQQELHQMKLNFFTNISHEIRTPLTLIVAPVEKLVKETQSDSYLSRQLLRIQQNTMRLLKLVNELMDFRKTESGKMQLHVCENEINAFAEDVFFSFNEVALANNINYTFERLKEPLAVYFDADQLEKVLFNLLSNAFKFTPKNGTISIRLTQNEQHVEIAVIDDGVGIPPESQQDIFTDFYQSNKHSQMHIGTGIGLAFSKSIVELHHGSLTFKSNLPEEQGKKQTQFTIALLKGKAHFNETELKENISVIPGQNTLNALNVLNKQPVLPDGGAAHIDDIDMVASTNGNMPEILVVEDNEEVRAFLIETLRPLYRVVGCENGLLGYQYATKEIPDIIITDVMMPEMDGMQLCEKLKTDVRTNHIPVIMLTARAASAHQVSGLETGADVYIAKPFSMEVLMLNIRNLMNLRATMQHKFSQHVTLQPSDVVIPAKDGEYLNKLIGIIEQHIDDSEFGVAELAVEIGMSQPVLYRKVKALTGLSVADFIKSIRLKRAANLLTQHKMTVADVAFAVGFNNRKHFSKEFRKQFNQSPSEFMANQGEQ